MRNDLSQKIKNMSIICAVLVVIIHVHWPHDSFGVTWLIENLVRLGIAQIAVPFFFIVSGYFLSAHFNETGWWGRETRKRVLTLMVPFVVWHLIFFAVTAPQSIVADILAKRPFGTSVYLFHPDLLHLLGFDIQEGLPALGPLWYVRALFILVCVSPLIKWLVGKLGLLWLILIFAVNVGFDYCSMGDASAESLPIRLLTFVFPLKGLLYFSVGIFIRERGPVVCGKRLTYVIGLVGGLLIVVNAGLRLCSCEAPIPLDQVMVPCVMYFVWSIVPSTKWPSWLCENSFPLYVVHGVMRPYTRYCHEIPRGGGRLSNLSF